ncbi:DNA-binding transcriptional MerR regulator/methylmalonyl-CoA mutase cobalamin-binding subunit [Pedobacter sp. UYP30]|uniref:MerR family transcriptional regulator n=1 Tax=Pedobacter sp. UYP30 TaxID=1756400 RepID=UPI003395B8F8
MNYNISDLEKLSGIQSHTIRVWERRYKILKPLRTLGNTRKYDDDELKKLLSIATLNKSGLKISKISKLSPADLNKLISRAEKSEVNQSGFDLIIAQVLNHVFDFDEQKVEILLNRAIQKFGLIECYKNIMYPLLVRLGFMWLKHNICPSNEHFLVNILRQKIIAETDAIPVVKDFRKTWLLFLPEQEDHDVGLLFAKYLLKKAGQKVIYLGGKVPLPDIAHIVKTISIDCVLLFMIKSRNSNEAQNYFDKLIEHCEGLPLYVAGNKEVLEHVEKPLGVTWLKTVNQFEECINNFVVL